MTDEGDHGGAESLSHGLRPCQLPFTREPALSVSYADSSPTVGAKDEGMRIATSLRSSQ